MTSRSWKDGFQQKKKIINKKSNDFRDRTRRFDILTYLLHFLKYAKGSVIKKKWKNKNLKIFILIKKFVKLVSSSHPTLQFTTETYVSKTRIVTPTDQPWKEAILITSLVQYTTKPAHRLFRFHRCNWGRRKKTLWTWLYIVSSDKSYINRSCILVSTNRRWSFANMNSSFLA